MRLPSVKDLPVVNKKVLLRANYDVPLRSAQGKLLVTDTTRIEESLATIKYLLKQKAKVVVISHLGRPGGKEASELSLKPVAILLKKLIGGSIEEVGSEKWEVGLGGWKLGRYLLLLENLRFDSKEEANDEHFAQKLALMADFYINDAFAVSHRKHASIVGVPKFFPSNRRAFGLDFLKEVKILKKIRQNPRRPVVLILGGVKKDKINAAKKMVHWADYILVGGKLVEYDGIPDLIKHPKIKGSLIKDGQDITMETVEEFKKIIERAGTIVWVGPMGNFYDKRYEKGTKEVAEAIVKTEAFTVIGGGDTEAALTRLGLVDKIDYVCSGGGAMLNFLADGTLVGIEAVIKS